ncbi:MAG: hypothetical protein EOP56_09175 [Sphingobacteriales bacterium]|nr:MAG: hypothetical protein EOP56_09175 [Sphingobacteriales bacterium]
MSTQSIAKVKGYKVANPEGKCRGYQYEVGKIYTHEGTVKVCGSGFHFCRIAADCFNYYSFNSSNKVFEVEASGTIEHGDDKSACSELLIVREIDWSELLTIVNTGKDNTGLGNTGDRNTGDSNTGDRNTGDSNTGYRNTGYRNTGYRNTGDRNTGNWNTGNWNTGNWNTGDRNTGDRNTGDRNTGNWNTGNWNTGYSNTGNRNTGVFCTGEEKIKLFNKPSDWTIDDFENSRAYRLMCDYVDTKMWVNESVMTDEEKLKYPSYKTAEGYLKDIPFKEAFTNAWHNWQEDSRSAFTSLPNFDKDIFFQITGVQL